jgi:LuxR family transcriptional regulator, maltose regulon positive regulatory protein
VSLEDAMPEVAQTGAPVPELPVRLRAPMTALADLYRPRLIHQLTDEPAPVTLVCAPAGAGKTSLLASWVATAATAPIAWLSLDHHDDDPSLLWAGILDALRGTGRFPAAARLHRLAAPARAIETTFIEAVLGEVAALREPVWLVLDDLHVIGSQATLDSLTRLVKHLVPNLHLVLTSRTDPPLGLPRLRLDGRLRELRAPELAFTLEEAAAFVADQRVTLSAPSLRTLHERTEGWVAGIKIAALALHEVEDPEAFVADFGGDDHAVADYLATEVLTNLSPLARDLLLRTSICEEVSVDLAQHLTGHLGAAATLGELERDNVFTRRLGRGRDTYRYHDLMRTFLAAELRRTDAALERELHIRAADWFERQGDALHAMEHLADAGAIERFTDLVGSHGVGAVLDGRARRLGSILETFHDQHAAVPVIALLGAAAALALGDLVTADRWLSRVDVAELASRPDRDFATLAAAVAAARARFDPRVDVALARLEATGVGNIANRDHDLYGLLQRGVLRMYSGRYADAVTDLERAAELARVTGRAAVQVECLSFLAGALGSQGELPEMRARAEEAVAVAELRGWGSSSALAHAYLLVSWGAYLEADSDTAVRYAALAVSTLGEASEPDVEFSVRSLEAVVGADGDAPFEAIRAYRRTFVRLADAQVSPALLAYALPALVRICLGLGERAWAREFAAAAEQRSPNPGEPALLRAMLQHDAGRTEAARKELAAITRGQATCHLPTTEVMAWLLAADLEQRAGNVTQAHDLLVEALQRAERFDLVRPFLDSDGIRDLLIAGHGRFGRYEPFAERLRTVPRPDRSVRDPSNESLTESELSVLRDLPSLLTLREIADARSVSVNTVKTHLRSVYRKLGVAGRRDAVEVGRRRGLL